MNLTKRLRVMADRWEEWAAILAPAAAAAVRECVADLRGELTPVTQRNTGRKPPASSDSQQ